MKRFNVYKSLSTLVLLGPLCFGQYKFEVKNASKNYTVIINVENCYDGRCHDKGTVELFDNKNTKVQTFTSEELVIELNENQKPTSGKLIQLTEQQSPVIIDDFNFDGTEDIAIRNGNNGNYQSDSYDVYVFNSTRMAFVKSKELTDLASNALGLFNVDYKRKRLISTGKSGCCRIFTTEYEVVPNKGLESVLEKEEDMTEESRVKVITKEKINNKWVTKTKVYPADKYNR
ncbi:hypothetical protein C1637_18235 [Chryseobacterium lactis]|uniref:VCBS repeat-containing protein n=1 Tax=Chryseobacterium lactis TaxID=1241981 RepID=A0A3G6RT31_CHRLC|nr:hypothetical protein [Chryseobacterium lactis]AZA84725.1 hypothetical protein EG342_23745 [Chryseobacterium lactis]AZB05114.1 hypothetical protein EG341_14625 [Chryseobacterium lactis]PNW12096.1 hypothetical protein C1637_18235 [Chryseobacterium lactis]